MGEKRLVLVNKTDRCQIGLLTVWVGGGRKVGLKSNDEFSQGFIKIDQMSLKGSCLCSV